MLSDGYPYNVADLTYATHHLPHFGALDTALALYGKPYLPLKKAVWYSLSGAIHRKKIRVIGRETDTRMNLAVCIKSGQGKKNVARTIKEICKGTELKYSSPNSLYPEQLLGRTLEEKDEKGKHIQNRGHLDENYLIIDEAIKLIRSDNPKIETSRNYINVALDTIGQNEIQKRLVKFKKDDTLTYEPDVTISLFFQPFSVDEEVVTVGFLRRFLTLYIKVNEEDMKLAYKRSVYGDPDREPSIRDICEFLKEVEKKKDTERKSTKETKDRIFELHSELIKQGYHFSPKGKRFTEIFGQTLLDVLSKMAYILACVEDSNYIEVRHVELAYMDLVEIFASILEWIEEKILGNMDYGESWSGAMAKDQRCLEWLEEKQDSHVRIREYWRKVAEIYEVSVHQGRKIYDRHVRYGWVERKQIGKHDSMVRLKIKPKIKGDQAGKGDPILRPTEYEKIIKNYSLT